MIKNLLFDLGGVIIDINRADCVASYARLGLQNPDSFFGEFSQQGPFKALESGDITPAEFHGIMRGYLPAGVTDAQIDAAFLDFLTGLPVHRLEALRELRRRFKVYMLSNTNAIMWNSKIAELFRQQGGEMADYFDDTVTSFEARALKPDPAIFNFAVEKLGIVPEETLFLDDSADNLRAAGRLGFNTALVRPGDEFTAVITHYLKSL